MPLETLYFYSHLILLLGNVMHYQSSMQCCPIRTAVGVNFTSVAGSPFFFNILLPGTVEHMEHYQVSLADDVLPHWMVFRPKTGSLEGLAVTEDIGTYHIKVSVTSEECTEYFPVHILKATMTGKEPRARWNTLSCSEKETHVWVTLILQMNPDSLDANLRIHLVNTMANYLHKQRGFVSLFLRQKSFILQENIIICRHGGLAEERQDAMGEVGELLWPVGCQGHEQRSDLAKVLEDTRQTGVLARLLGTPVLGWRMLCAAGVARHKVKRDTQGSKSTTSNISVSPPNHIRRIEVSFRNKQEPQDTSGATLSVFFNTRQTFLLGSFKATSAPRLDENLDSTKTFVREISLEEVSELSSTAAQFHMKTLTFSENSNICENFALRKSEVSACQWFLDEHVTSHLSGSFLLPFTPYSIYPIIPLTSNYFSVTSTVTYAVVNRETLTTRLTRRPHQRGSPIWTGAHRATHSDSESQSTVSSLGQMNYSQDFNKDFNATKASLHNSPSVSHPPPADNNGPFLLNSRLTSIQSPLPSNKIPSTRTLSDVSLVSYAMTKLLSITEPFATVQHLPQAPSGVYKVMSQLNVTIKDTSSTTSQSQLILSGQSELESSLSPSLLYTPEPSEATLTPPLPPELSFSGQLETSDHKLAFTVESLTASLSSVQVLQTCCKTPLESQFVVELQSKSEMQNSTEFYFDHNGLTRVLSSDILVTYSLQVSLSSTNAVSSSVGQTLRHSQESQESVSNSSSALISDSSAAQTPSKQYSLEAATVSPHLSSSAPFQLELSESESIRSVTLTPSAGQEPNSASSIHEMLSLEPSFPLCDHHMYASRCTLSIHTTYPDNTQGTVLNFLSSGSYDEQHWTALDSPLSTLSADTGSYVEYVSMGFESTSSESVLVQSSRLNHLISLMSTADESSTTSALSDINSLTASQPMHSDTQGPLYVSGLSLTLYSSLTLSTSVLNGYCVTVKSSLFICQSSVQDGVRPISKGNPTQQISTFFSQSSGIFATSVHTVSHSSSPVQASSSSSISSFINLPPKVLQTIPPLTATVGFPFLYSIPKQTFIDPEDGEADTLFLEMRLIDGPPPSMGSWLVLDGLELHGVPLEVDRRFTPQHFLLEARDTQGLSTRLHLMLDLHQSPTEPCHVFTMKVQVSLHSILRHRHKVELLLRKITGFFNSSSSRQLSVVSVAPGSTVSWYNYSLCETPHCHDDKVKSMWLAMSSTDEEVNPTFREAMLPEFPVVKVGLVSNKYDCFSATPTSTFGRPTPAVHTTLYPAPDTSNSTSTTGVSASTVIISTSEQTDSYKWMAGMFTALLVICILILIVLLVATILYFCQRRSRIVAIWPASRTLSVQSKNSRAIRPRRPPLLLPELPPPPLRLWINLTQPDEEPLSRSARNT